MYVIYYYIHCTCTRVRTQRSRLTARCSVSAELLSLINKVPYLTAGSFVWITNVRVTSVNIYRCHVPVCMRLGYAANRTSLSIFYVNCSPGICRTRANCVPEVYDQYSLSPAFFMLTRNYQYYYCYISLL